MLLTRRQIVLLVLLTFFWGFNWPVMKFAVNNGITPLFYRCITMGGGCLFLIVCLKVQRTSLFVSLIDLWRIFWLALPNVVCWHTFSILGVGQLPSGRASILGFTMPIWTALLGALILGQRLNNRIWISIIAAAAAVGLLSANELSHMAGSPIGIVWMQIAALSWAFGTVLFGRIKPQARIEVVTAWMLGIGATILGCIASFLETPPSWDYSYMMWGAIFYGMFINFGLGQLIWFGMASSLPPAASAFSIMAIPLVSIFSAALFFNETPHLTDFIAAACIIVAIGSAVLGKKPMPYKPIKTRENP